MARRSPARQPSKKVRTESTIAAIREKSSFLAMCDTPDIAVEISLQPFRRFGMDGVVVFSDILLPLRGGGLELEFAPGPVIANPLRGAGDLGRLSVDVGAAIAPTCEALRRLRRELGPRAALIGFAGAPWTLAAYATESRLSRNLEVLSALSWRDPDTLQKILERTAQICADALRLQIEAGADCVQIFDTWAGELDRPRFAQFAGRAIRRVLTLLGPDRPPVIVYARGAAHLLEDIADLGADVVSLDWRSDLGDAAARVGQRVSLQGNLDPTALLGPLTGIARSVREAMIGSPIPSTHTRVRAPWPRSASASGSSA
jgi:uroporphyrinogen decarboxylase